MDQGYFANEGIDVNPVFFRSEADVVSALSSNKVDVATISPGAALFNALALGVNATIVADYWASGKDVPAGDSAAIVVRKELAPYGTFKPKDVKGLTMAVAAHGTTSELFAETFLRSVNAPTGDLNIVDMPSPDMAAALKTEAVDFAAPSDPYATIIAEQGVAVKVAGLASLMPGFVQGVIMYGAGLSRGDRALGLRFLRAFSKANAYLRTHATTAAGRAAIAAIYQKYVPLADPSLYQKIGLAIAPAKLTVVVDGNYALRWQMQQYVQAGLVEHAPDLSRSVDNSFNEELARAK